MRQRAAATGRRQRSVAARADQRLVLTDGVKVLVLEQLARARADLAGRDAGVDELCQLGAGHLLQAQRPHALQQRRAERGRARHEVRERAAGQGGSGSAGHSRRCISIPPLQHPKLRLTSETLR